jgi:acetoin:2,6-dichlorophenolindophenol oxidoreductase subunit alpha
MLLETYTYRTRGHYEPDDQSYVDRDELAQWRARDPIELMRERLLAERRIVPDQLEHIRERVTDAMAEALAFASNSPFPVASELTTDVYA